MKQQVGKVFSLLRYPVKSMLGEELKAADVVESGLYADRAYALVDTETGKVASAKNPKRWPNLFQFRAAYVQPPQPGEDIPAVRITLHNGNSVTSDDRNVNEVLSEALGRGVTIRKTQPTQHVSTQQILEEYWPNLEELAHRDAVTDEPMPEGTFFDVAVVHLLSTATMNRLREFYPGGRFDVMRFRPNVVVETTAKSSGFVEDEWEGGIVSMGDLSIRVTGPCTRCVMTTLAQADLPQDLGILKTAAKHNKAHVGIYASVAHAGRVAVGDAVSVELRTTAVA